jgi:hypothetical protein
MEFREGIEEEMRIMCSDAGISSVSAVISVEAR